MIKYLRHMVVFAHVVEGQGISAAAEKLNVSKSVVSQQINALEQELGVSLMNRNTRSQVLTDAGEAFYEHCRKISQVATSAWETARESQQLAKGSIRISAPNALVEPIVAPAISRLVGQHEDIIPTLLCNDNRVHLIEENIDLAIRVGGMPSSDYKQRKLGSFSDLLCASPGYLEQRGITQQWLSKQGRSAIAVNYVANSWQGNHIKHRLTHRKSGKSLLLNFRANRMCNSLPAVIEMARAGCGLAFIPDFIFNRYERTKQLTAVMPDYRCESATIYAVHAYGSNVPTLVRLAIETIGKQVAEVIHS